MNLCLFSSDETDLFQTITNGFVNPTVKVRIQYLLNWYHKKVTRYKFLSRCGSCLSILFPAVITFISGTKCFGENVVEWLVPLLSVCASAGAGIYAVFCSKDSWLRYRLAIEKIKSESLLFLVNKNDIDETEEQFFSRIEKIAADELSQWYQLRSANENKGSNLPSGSQNDSGTT